MGTLTVRVVPRSGRRALEVAEGGVTVRVRAAPEAGRATQEALRVVADALGVPQSTVTLRSGPRSRTKVFAVEGLSEAEIAGRLG